MTFFTNVEMNVLMNVKVSWLVSLSMGFGE